MGNRVAKKHKAANIPLELSNCDPDNIYLNMMCVIKLRSKGPTKLSKLPKSVLRCILEYQYPKPMLLRYSDPFYYDQNRHFPTIY